MEITAAYIGQIVVLPSGEHGRVTRIDHDENMLYVDVATATGVDTIDVDPADVAPRD